MTAETPAAPLHVLYLDFDGVLHPDAVYRTRNAIELLHHPGHSLFEHVSLLEEVLAPYPSVKIVLSTSWILLDGGYEFAKSQLSLCLQERCIGGTFNRREVRKAWFKSMSRPEQVVLDVESRRPARWMAVDDWPHEWPDWAQSHVALAHPKYGLAEAGVLRKLKAKLRKEFSGDAHLGF